MENNERKIMEIDEKTSDDQPEFNYKGIKAMPLIIGLNKDSSFLEFPLISL